MGWIREALQQVADQLSAAGIPTTVDQRNLNPPGGWVEASGIAFDRYAPSVRTLTVTVYLISRDLGTPESLDVLADLIDRAATVMPFGAVTVGTVTLANHAGDALPMVTFTLTLEIS